jgi:hypothetical protein
MVPLPAQLPPASLQSLSLMPTFFQHYKLVLKCPVAAKEGSADMYSRKQQFKHKKKLAWQDLSQARDKVLASMAGRHAYNPQAHVFLLAFWPLKTTLQMRKMQIIKPGYTV